MEERGNYETMGKVAHLYTKKIRSCSGLLTIMTLVARRLVMAVTWRQTA
jgi:hypothetical protein